MAFWIEARYDGQCATKDCLNGIREGDRILIDDGGPYCRECGEDIKPEPLNGADSAGPHGPGAKRGRLL